MGLRVVLLDTIVIFLMVSGFLLHIRLADFSYISADFLKLPASAKIILELEIELILIVNYYAAYVM
jgi:hypothetical protein